MGKKKRPFIDKRTAHSYRVVHRSQKDPLQADDESSAYVLQPLNQPEHEGAATGGGTGADYDPETQREEMRTYGIYYDDGYDYMQHLRTREDDVVELEETIYADKHKNDPIQISRNLKLPGSVFASEFEEDVGVLNLAAPKPGPRLDMDPDIVETLDEDYTMFIDAENPDDFEDDFVLLANGGEAPDLDELDEEAMRDERLRAAGLINEEEGEEEEGKGQKGQEKGDADEDDEGDWEDMDTDDEEDDDEDEDDEGDCDSDARSDVAVNDMFDEMYHRMQLGLDLDDDRKSRYTTYSATSAVLKRNEGLKLLDARFDEEMKKWDDEYMEEGPTLPPERVEQIIRDSMAKDMKGRPDLEALLNSDEVKDSKQYRRVMKAITERYRYEHSDDDEAAPEEIMELVSVPSSKPQFDIESIRSFSSKSRQRNMPAIIPNPAKAKKTTKMQPAAAEKADSSATAAPQPVQLDRKTGLPTGILNERAKKPEAVAAAPTAVPTFDRRKDETPEEKKARKKATKDGKRERRVEKKENKSQYQRRHHAEQCSVQGPTGIRM